MIIDFHTHCFPDNLYERAMAKLSVSTAQVPVFDGSVGGLLEYMKENGVDKSVVCSIATNAKQNNNVNNFSLSLLEYDGLIPFGSIHFDFEGYKDELKRLKDAGIKGIKFHPEYQGFYINEKKMYPLYEECCKMGFILIFHTGIDPAYPEDVHATPERTLEVYKNLGRYDKFIAAHMGGPGFWEEVLELLCGTGMYLETSFGLNLMDKKTAIDIVKAHSADKILFGSDSPWASAKKSIQRITALGLSEGDNDKIFYKNAQKLLGLK